MENIKDLTEAPVEQMSKAINNAFIVLTMAENESKGVPKEAREDPIFRILSGRLDKPDDYSAYLRFFLACLCEGNPGKAVMWAYTIWKNNIKSMRNLAFAFPTGFPTNDGMQEVWESQKGVEGEKGNRRSFNWLDRAEAWKR
jgi:hypothetical protein